MLRFVKMSKKWYAYEIYNVFSDEENITDFVSGGEIVVLCETIEDFAEEFDIDIREIEVVE